MSAIRPWFRKHGKYRILDLYNSTLRYELHVFSSRVPILNSVREKLGERKNSGEEEEAVCFSVVERWSSFNPGSIP